MNNPDRRLLFVASGSYEAAILKRNAQSRLAAMTLDGFFSQVDYVFFRTDAAATHNVSPRFTAYDVSGSQPPGLLKRLKWLRRIVVFLTGLRQIFAIARRADPHVVAIVEPFIPGVVGWLIARCRRLPLVVHLVSDYRMSYRVAGAKGIPFLPARIVFAVERFILTRADLIFTDTRYYGDYAVSLGAAPQRVCVVPRYADDLFYEGRPDAGVWNELGIPDHRPLAYVGRLSPEKYALDLVDCFASVSRRFPERHLVLIGGGRQQREVFDRAQSLGVADRMHVLEGLSRQQILSAMATSGAMLVTHGGYALLEACLAGAPIVAYDYEWHPEVILHGRTGLLAAYRDPEAMAAGAIELLGDPERARSLADAARSDCRSRYRPEAYKAVQRDRLQRLLGDKAEQVKEAKQLREIARNPI